MIRFKKQNFYPSIQSKSILKSRFICSTNKICIRISRKLNGSEIPLILMGSFSKHFYKYTEKGDLQSGTRSMHAWFMYHVVVEPSGQQIELYGKSYHICMERVPQLFWYHICLELVPKLFKSSGTCSTTYEKRCGTCPMPHCSKHRKPVELVPCLVLPRGYGICSRH